MGSRPTNNPYGDTQLVDRLVGTAYDVVKLVSDNIIYVKHISVNMEHVLIANENIDIILPVSQQIDKVILIADNMAGLTSIQNNLPLLQSLFDNMLLLTQMASQLPAIVNVNAHINDILTVIANLDNIRTIIQSLPDIKQVLAQTPAILAAVKDAKEYAEAALSYSSQSSSAAAQSATARNAAQASATAASNSATNSQTAANSSQANATAAEQARVAAAAIRDGLLAGITASAMGVPSGSPAKATYNAGTKNIAFEIPAGSTGNTGPANSLAIGTVASGPAPSATITGQAPNQTLNMVLSKGDGGWTPVIAIATDGDRRVQRVVDWTGGSGDKPNTGMYIGLTGFVIDINQAVNVRGAGGSGSGDMSASVYDPAERQMDVYAMDSMLEGANTKIMTGAERTKLAGIAAGANKTPVLATVATTGSYADLSNKPNIPAGTVTSVGITPPEGMSASADITEAGKIVLALMNGYNFFTNTQLAKLNGIAAGATQNATDAALRDRSTHTGSQPMSSITGLSQAIADALVPAEKTANKNQANGYAGLDNNGKVATAQLPEAVLGALKYQGTWNASTNVPGIPFPSATNKGWYYVVATAGSTNIGGVNDWQVGDWIVCNGTSWDKIDSSDQVNSVNGKQGSVVLVKSDIGLGNVDNTTDAAKPISNATQTALNGKAATVHTHPISQVTDLQTTLDSKASAAISIAAAGLATGGGDLAANRTITVPKATSAQAVAGVIDTVAMTPLNVAQYAAGNDLAISKADPSISLNKTNAVTANWKISCDADGTFQIVDIKNDRQVFAVSQAGEPYLGNGIGNVKNYIDSKGGIGNGQTWQNVSASRGTNVTYQNTTGKTMMVIVSGAASGLDTNFAGQVSVDGTTWVTLFSHNLQIFDSNLQTQKKVSATFVVPPGHYYRVNRGSGNGTYRPESWVELS